MALSSDGTKLFVDAYCSDARISVIDPQSLKTITSIADRIGVDSMFLSGTTLLLASGTQLLYFDTTTLEQTGSAGVPYDSWVFGVSPDGSKIYLGSDCLCGGPETMEVVDFSSGKTLASRTFPNVGLYALLSPDGAQIVVASNPILLVDPATLATTQTLTPAGPPDFAAYLDTDTVLMLYSSTGAMMVVDQSSATVTDAFPLGVSFVAFRRRASRPLSERTSGSSGVRTEASSWIPCSNRSRALGMRATTASASSSSPADRSASTAGSANSVQIPSSGIFCARAASNLSQKRRASDRASATLTTLRSVSVPQPVVVPQ